MYFNSCLQRMVCSAICCAAPLWSAVAVPEDPPPDVPDPTPPITNQALAHDIFRDLVMARSDHEVGTAATASVVVQYLKMNGFTDSDIQMLPEPEHPDQVNVVVRLRGRGVGKPVMWLCHLDVVPARAEDWTVPPYAFIESEGWFYGRGTSDMKDQDAAVVASLIRLKQDGFVPSRDIVAAFTADEELGQDQDGAAFLLKTHPEAIDADLVINPDAQSGKILNGRRLGYSVGTSEKAYVTYAVTVTNKGGHSSEPRPDNAIYQLSHVLARLEHYHFPFKITPTTQLYFKEASRTRTGRRAADMLSLANSSTVDEAAATRLSKDAEMNSLLHSTCVATMLSAGVYENALPNSAVATVQCRLMPGETAEGTQETLRRIAADSTIKVARIGDIIRGPDSPPTTDILASVTTVVHSMWPDVAVIPEMVAFSTDSVFTRRAGIASYGVSGGWSDITDIRMHGLDERMSSSTFYQSVEFTYRLMKQLGGTH